MSDTPEKKDTPDSEANDFSDKKSPWFVTPMGDKKPEGNPFADGKPEDDQPEKKQDKIKFQPTGASDSPSESPQKSAPAASAPKPSPQPTAPSANPLAGGSSITFDDDGAGSESVSKPILAVDAVAAAIAIAFAVLILRDVLPFL